MDRRTFLGTIAGALLAAPLAAGAQQTGKVYRIGFLRQGSPPRPWVEAFQQGLQELGYVQGRNVVVEFRLTDGSLDQLPQLAEELVRLRVDVILASASSAALAAKRATTSVPIVFTGVYDPVEIGLVASLGHPGGNITGLAVNASDMAGKRLQLLRELIPKAKRVAMLSHPPHPTNARQLEGAETVARALGVQLEAVPVRGAEILILRSRHYAASTGCCTPIHRSSRRTVLGSRRSWRGGGCPPSFPSGDTWTLAASCRTGQTNRIYSGAQRPT